MTVSIEYWVGGEKISETKAVSSVIEARRQMQSIRKKINFDPHTITCLGINVIADTPNRIAYSNQSNQVVEYRIVKYFTKEPL